MADGSAWTDQARYTLLLHIIAQLKGARSVDWKSIKIPGRTVKSLQNQWTKIQKEIDSLDNSASSRASTPRTTPHTSAKKSRVKTETPVKDEARDDDWEEDESPSKAAAKKRAKASTQSERPMKRARSATLDLKSEEYDASEV